MNKFLLTMASAVIAIGIGAVSTPASAFLDDNSCKGKQSCNDNSTNNEGGAGGEGGDGGDGGDAFQFQGQQQGIFGSGNSTIGDVGTDNGNNNGNNNGFNGNFNGGNGNLDNVANTDNANNSNQSVTIEGDVFQAADIPVSTATSAALTSADDTCMGSSSIGVQGMMFGLSFGTTWRDEDCVRRKDSRMFYNMQMKDVAVARMCQKDDNRAAVEAAGGVCPGTEASVIIIAE